MANQCSVYWIRRVVEPVSAHGGDVLNTSRTKTIAVGLVAMVVATAGVLLTGTASVAGQQEGALKLEGAWIARVTAPAFPVTPQWTYVLVPDPSGRRASIFGSIDAGFGTPGIDHDSPLLGQAVQTGPDTAKFNVVWHRMDAPGHILAIGTASGTVTSVAPGKIRAEVNFAIYPPTADADGDGLPDPDTTVVPKTFSVTTVDTRVMSPGFGG